MIDGEANCRTVNPKDGDLLDGMRTNLEETLVNLSDSQRGSSTKVHLSAASVPEVKYGVVLNARPDRSKKVLLDRAGYQGLLVLVRTGDLDFVDSAPLVQGLDHDPGAVTLSAEGKYTAPFASSGRLSSNTGQSIYVLHRRGKLLIADKKGCFRLHIHGQNGDIESRKPTADEVGDFVIAYGHYTKKTVNALRGLEWCRDVLRQLSLAGRILELPT